jgi:hypothetical protein
MQARYPALILMTLAIVSAGAMVHYTNLWFGVPAIVSGLLTMMVISRHPSPSDQFRWR